LAKINSHNKIESRTYDMGVNQFTHLTQEEFAQTYLGTIVPKTNKIFIYSNHLFGYDG